MSAHDTPDDTEIVKRVRRWLDSRKEGDIDMRDLRRVCWLAEQGLNTPSESVSSEIERAYQMLEACGVPRERAKNLANGIDVLATRFRRDEGFQRMAEADAARYRWWRKWWADSADDMEHINDVQGQCSTAEELDAAIDAAIKEGK